MVNINFTVNGKPYEISIDENMRLIDVLRDELGLIGTKEGCGEGECGACTIIMDGETVNSCLVMGFQADGSNIVTIEGLERMDSFIQCNEPIWSRGCTMWFLYPWHGLVYQGPIRQKS